MTDGQHRRDKVSPFDVGRTVELVKIVKPDAIIFKSIAPG
jgi:hypothetical protein